MNDKSFSREDRITQLLKFSDEIQALFEEEFSQNIIEELIERIGNFFNVGKIYFVKCFGINYWEVRITWTKTKQFFKPHICGNWENLVNLFSYLSLGNHVTDDVSEYSQELSKWKSYFQASNILLIPTLRDKKLTGIFILQDVEKNSFTKKRSSS